MDREMITTVYRDMQGTVVNIGPWDSCPLFDDETGITTHANPMPPGLVVTQEEVIAGKDGGRYVAGDPRAEA